MSSNKHEILFMLGSLKLMQDKIGGPNAKRSLGGSEFDIIQDEFLARRHEIQKLQDQKEREGLTTKNADIAYKIREGYEQMKQLLAKLKAEYERLTRKAKDPQNVLDSKKKIVDNCELLFKDIEERIYGESTPDNYKKHMTLTDMKAKLLSEIDTANYRIHNNAGSEDNLAESDSQEREAMEAYKKKDEQVDIVMDEIIVGVQGVRQKVKMINEKQDEVNQKVQAGNKQMTKLQNRIKTDNEKLKVIIEKFKPARCCLAIFLFLLIVGLVVVIIKFLVPQ